MKKTLFACITAATACVSLSAFPLEWNKFQQTGVPYEVEISRGKLQKLAGVDANCGFEVTATTAEGKQKLDVTLLEGQKKDSLAIRFTVPAGTLSLDCVPAGNGDITPAGTLNLFENALKTPAKWKARNRGTVKAVNGKLVFEAKKFGDTLFTHTVDVPAEFAGRGAKLEMDFKSTAAETWPCLINIDQIDANGKVLSESVTDPRWISLMRPSNILTEHRENGRIHPKAAKLQIRIIATGIKHSYGAYGKPIKDPSVFLPKFEISRLAVRAADQIPFPKYRDEFFCEGISGEEGDYAFDTTKGKTGKAFFFATHSQACWAEGKTITDPQELFYPAGNGTVEAYFYPVKNKRKSNKNFYVLFSADPAPFVGIMSARGGNTNPCLSIKYYPKKQKALLEFQDYTKKVYKKEFSCTIAYNSWSHIAVQWSNEKGMQVFINGKTTFEDSNFKFTPVDVTSDMIRKAKEGYQKTGNEYIASQFSLGNTRFTVRSNKVGHGVPHFNGKIDLLRISSVTRYDGDFTPAKKFEVDKDTRALFDFNRSFDGKTSDGLQVISGSVMAEVSRIEDKLDVNGKVIDYNPPAIIDSAHPFKVLDKRNYTNLPEKEDFAAARKTEQLKLKFNGNTKKTINVDETVYMDYLEYKNVGKKDVIHPFIRRDVEIDPRSFGDVRESMNVANSSARTRTNRIFQFMLSSSDYYMSYQARFTPGSDTPHYACYDALLMLNAYCGFECGPLNNMTANMFSCAGDIPASQTGGYGHSFQQAWVNGKSNLYDLSAQKFFTAFNNTEPASLGDVELEPGIQNRVDGNSDHFIRIGTRRYVANEPAFIERVAMTIRPGESLRMWYMNDGRSNTLQWITPGRLNNFQKPYARDVTKLVNAKPNRFPVSEVDSFFPEFGSAYLKFNAKPSAYAKNFTMVKPDSFCYKVFTCYPIVCAEYSAKKADGTFAKLEISTDRGKTFRDLKLDKDGVTRPFYPVCARREYLIRVKAPMNSITNFSAMTQMMTNVRVMTCKLAKGANNLIYTAENSGDIEITMQYRKYAKDIEIKGAVLSGAAKGWERINTAIAPGETKTFEVNGASSSAAVKTTGKLKAALKNGKLTVTAAKGNYKSVEGVTIVDGKAEKQLIVVVAPGIELVTADKITPVKDAKVGGQFQKSVDLKGYRSTLKVNFSKQKSAGKYTIWICRRTSIDPSWTRVHVDLPQGGSTEIFRHWNCSNEFYKSRYYGKDGRGRYTWDYPFDPEIRYPFQQIHVLDITKPFSSLNFRYDNMSQELTEVAAVMIMPDPGREFSNEMARAIRSVNNNQLYVTEKNK